MFGKRLHLVSIINFLRACYCHYSLPSSSPKSSYSVSRITLHSTANNLTHSFINQIFSDLIMTGVSELN